MPDIFHLVPAAEFYALPEGQPYVPTAFAHDGFIHCTAELELMLQVANTFYRQTPGEIVVLVIDPAQLTATLKWETPTAKTDPHANRLFPHIYGPLNREAIVAIRPAQRAPDGSFIAV